MTLSISSPSRVAVTLQQLFNAKSTASHQLQQALAAMMAPSAQGSSAQSDSKPADSITDIPFNQFCLDSRQLASNDVFVLLKSHIPNCQKSRDYLFQAAKNAAFILSEIDPIALISAANTPAHANIALTDESSSAEQQQLALLPCPVLFVIFWAVLFKCVCSIHSP